MTFFKAMNRVRSNVHGAGVCSEPDPFEGISNPFCIGVSIASEVAQVGMAHRLPPGLRIGDPG